MEFAFSPEQEARYRRTVEFGRVGLRYDLKRAEAEGGFPREAWTAAGREGLLAMPIPRDLGGGGLDLVSTARAWEGLGYGCADPGLCFSLAAHLVTVAVPIWKFGTDSQKARWLPRLLDGTWIAGNASTEPEAGSDLFSMKARGVDVGGGYEITGTKLYVTNAPIADLLLVYAVTGPADRTPSEITAFVLERATPGLRVETQPAKMGLKTSPSGRLVLDRVRAETTDRLGAPGAGRAHFQLSMDWERTLLFAPALGGMERQLEMAIQHARTRRQFGRPIGKFQAVANRIVEMKSRLDAARLLLYRAAWTLQDAGRATLEACLAKRFVADAWVRSSVDLIQILGASGISADGDAVRQLTAAIPSTIASGTTEMQELIVARWLGL